MVVEQVHLEDGCFGEELQRKKCIYVHDAYFLLWEKRNLLFIIYCSQSLTM